MVNTQQESLQDESYDYFTDINISEFADYGEPVPVTSYGTRTSTTVFESITQKQYSVPSFDTRVKKILCGENWFIILTENGSVYHKQASSDIYTKRNEGKCIVDIGCGHTIFAMQTSQNNIVLVNNNYQTELEYEFPHKTFKSGRFKQMTGGISSMIFLVEVDKTSGVEDQLFTFGKNSLNGLGAQPRNAETIIPWNPIALRGKKISQIACGGYHTLFLCGTKVYCVGYNSNGELGQIDSSSVADVKEMTWLEEPIRHISCGHFSTVFVTTDNKVLVTGCNEDNSLGVGESYNGRNVRRILTLQHFDFLVDDVFVGAYHWLIKTKRHGLFYTGKPRAEKTRGDIAPINPDPTFIKCVGDICQRNMHDMQIACGNGFSVVYWPCEKGTMHFTASFVHSLVCGEEKANKFTDLTILNIK